MPKPAENLSSLHFQLLDLGLLFLLLPPVLPLFHLPLFLRVIYLPDPLLDLPPLLLPLLRSLLSLGGMNGPPVVLSYLRSVLVSLGFSLPGQLVSLDLVNEVEHQLHQWLGLLNDLLQVPIL